MARTITCGNHKGGTGKTATTISLGAALAQRGKRILLVDADAQGNLSTSLGIQDIDGGTYDVLEAAINDTELTKNVVIHHEEGMDIIPANLDLASMDIMLINAMNRERMLHFGLEQFKSKYDYILIDSAPSLGMLTINALAAADSVIIPVKSEYLPAMGMAQITHTIQLIKRGINPDIKIEGVLLTMTDHRTRMSKDTAKLVRDTYGSRINIFDTEIPRAVKVAESSATGKSILVHEPSGKAAEAYISLAKEVLKNGRQKSRNEPSFTR